MIRAPLATCMIVQGGPGTGKTAVGLHRAAFLLYEHRGKLDREGVLVIGPNPLFLRYIAQVLPSLGETAVRQTTLGRLLAGTSYRVRSRDDEATERLKGDPRMAGVSEAQLEVVDEEVRRLVDECYAEARRLLRENRDKLDAIVDQLLARETLDEAEVYAAANIPRSSTPPGPTGLPAMPVPVTVREAGE